MGIGGSARTILIPESEEDFVQTAIENPLIPLIAGGSNTLIADKLFDQIFLLKNPFYEPRFLSGNILEVSAPQKIPALTTFFKQNNLSGIEFMAGVPRVSFGGAIYQNFGAFDKKIENIIISVKALANNKIITLSKDECGFAYRSSIFKKNNYKIISAQMHYTKGDSSRFTEDIEKIINFRKKHQPLKFPNIGSIFKNPQGCYAGKLIEDLGLRGFSIGGAQIWEHHANFIINKNNATYNDVIELIETIQKKSKKRYNILLEPEISILR